jgi:hypothetical protein
MKPAVATLALGLLLAGLAPCRALADDGSARHAAPLPVATLFISPSGQPFRAAPGEPYPVGQWFAQADKNKDGHLDRAEFRADAEAFFHILDENHDGVIDGFEVQDYEQKIAPEISGAYGAASGFSSGSGGGRRRHGGPDSPGAGGRGPSADSSAVMQGAAVYGLLDEPEPVSATDLNLDSRITLAEFLVMADRRFDLLDAKHLGYLTLDTLPKTPAQIMSEPKKH